MDPGRALALAEGEGIPADLDTGERALATLTRRCAVAPAALETGDLKEVQTAFGRRGAVEIGATVAYFHFVNRVGDLVGIQSDLPIVRPRFAALRRVGIRLHAWMVGRLVGLAPRDLDAEIDADAALETVARVLGALPPGFQSLREAPNAAGFLEILARAASTVPASMREQVRAGVEAALPRGEDDAMGFHTRPEAPTEALVFVGTRYASRTTPTLIEAVRRGTGYGDPELTDLIFAIGFENAWARMRRLFAEPLP